MAKLKIIKKITNSHILSLSMTIEREGILYLNNDMRFRALVMRSELRWTVLIEENQHEIFISQNFKEYYLLISISKKKKKKKKKIMYSSSSSDAFRNKPIPINFLNVYSTRAVFFRQNLYSFLNLLKR